MLLRPHRIWTTALFAALATAPAFAAVSPLALAPADAPALLYLHGWQRTHDRLTTMLQKALPGAQGAELAGQLDDLISKVLGDRKLDGLADDGPVFVVLTELPKPKQTTPPAVAVIVRVTDYAAFRDGVLTDDERRAIQVNRAGYEAARVGDTPVFFVDRKDYAVVTTDEKSATRLAKKYEGLDGKLDKDVGRKLLDSDVALFVNVEAVNQLYGDDLKDAESSFQLMVLDQAKERGMDKEARELFRTLFGALFQLVEDTRTFLTTVRFEPDGLAVHVEARVLADSKTDEFLKLGKASALDELGTLPGGYFMASATASAADDIPALKSLQALLVDKKSPEQLKAMEQSRDLKQAAGSHVQLSLERDSMNAEGLQVELCDDPAKRVAAELAVTASLQPGSGFVASVLKARPVIEKDAKKYRGFTLSRIHLTMDLDQMARTMGISKRGLLSLGSSEEQDSWVGFKDTTYVQATAKDWDAASRLLDAYLDGGDTLGKQKAFQDARKHFPPKVSVLYVQDVSEYFQKMAVFVLENVQGLHNLPDEGKPRIPPPLQGPRAYYGGSFTLQPEYVAIDFWGPGAMLREYYRVMENGIFAQMQEKP